GPGGGTTGSQPAYRTLVGRPQQNHAPDLLPPGGEAGIGGSGNRTRVDVARVRGNQGVASLSVAGSACQKLIHHSLKRAGRCGIELPRDCRRANPAHSLPSWITTPAGRTTCPPGVLIMRLHSF